jgi:YhcH/YjgK/YiaL family protein
MIVDNIDNLKKYQVISDKLQNKILNFLKSESELIPDGKYILEGESLFALVQSYETKEKETCKLEAHKKYIDLQYIWKGREHMYCDFTDTLTEVIPYSEEADISFYEYREERITLLLEEGMFALLFPTDAHMPCCSVGKSEYVKKVVFKIKKS